MPDMTGFNVNNKAKMPINSAFSKNESPQTPVNTDFDVQDAQQRHHASPEKQIQAPLKAPENEPLLNENHVKNPPKNQPDPAFCFLNVLKPKGITSFDVIYKLRKRLGIKKIGHSGTLDPLAEGVMQVAIGKATRLIDFLGSDKKYVANIKFGYISETGDAEGEITPVNIPNFTYDALLAALNSLNGEIEQVPPVYSAIKVGGKKLCDLARAKSKKSKTPKNTPNQKNEKSDQNQGTMPENTNLSRENPTHPCENTDIDTLKPAPNGTISRLAMSESNPPQTLQIRINTPSNADFIGVCADAAPELEKAVPKLEKAAPELEKAAPELKKNYSDEDFQTDKINNSSQNYPSDVDLLSDIKIPKRNVTIYETKILSFVTISGEKFAPESEKFAPENEKSAHKNEKNTPETPHSQISEIELEISCSKGTYIRSFAVDLAQKLNTGAYLTALKRVRAGNFDIENSVKIEDVSLQEHGINPLMALDLPVYELSDEEFKLVLNGVKIDFKAEKQRSVYLDCRARKGSLALMPQSPLGTPDVPGSCGCFAPVGSHPTSPSLCSSRKLDVCSLGTPDVILLVFNQNLVSVAHLRDNKIVPDKVFK